MNTEVYIREGGTGIRHHLGAEVVDEWEDGCLIRSEERLETAPFISYYIVEGQALVAVKLGEPSGTGPFDYSVELDRSDVRSLPAFEVGSA
jgi:hypothetical protein